MRAASLPLALLASVLVATASARVAQQRPLLLGSREATAAAVRTVLRPVRRTRRGLPSGRYLLEYADVRPYDERSAECQLFLATNVAFFAVGGCVAGGEPLLALQLELAGAGSIWYHLNQCCYGGTRHPLVQLAMLVDYAFAVPAALRALVLAADLATRCLTARSRWPWRRWRHLWRGGSGTGRDPTWWCTGCGTCSAPLRRIRSPWRTPRSRWGESARGGAAHR